MEIAELHVRNFLFGPFVKPPLCVKIYQQVCRKITIPLSITVAFSEDF